MRGSADGSSGLGCLAWWEPSTPGLGSREKLHHGRRWGFDEVEMGKESGLGSFSQALLGQAA